MSQIFTRKELQFTFEKNNTSNQNRGRCYCTCEIYDSSNQKPQRALVLGVASQTFNEKESEHGVEKV